MCNLFPSKTASARYCDTPKTYDLLEKLTIEPVTAVEKDVFLWVFRWKTTCSRLNALKLGSTYSATRMQLFTCNGCCAVRPEVYTVKSTTNRGHPRAKSRVYGPRPRARFRRNDYAGLGPFTRNKRAFSPRSTAARKLPVVRRTQ